MLPFAVSVHVQVGTVNTIEFDPPLKVRFSVNTMGVPQTKLGKVVTENGIRLAPLLPTARFGYADCFWVTVTPGVVVESVLSTCEAVRHPAFVIVMLRVLHSSLSMIPLPLPPETAHDT